MSTHADCLIEIGMEELPPLAMQPLSVALEAGLRERLSAARLGFGDIESFAAPRRLAVLVRDLERQQPDETELLRGPPVRVAFDDSGEPTRAAEAFAAKAGVTVADLDRQSTDKGEWLVFEAHRDGEPASALLGDMVAESLDALPIPRRMRWGDGDASFIRPLHWLVMLHGNDVVDATLYGVASGRRSRGHRFHHPDWVNIDTPASYEATMRDAYVIARFSERRELVWSRACAAASEVGGTLVEDTALIDEVAALCDWPVAVLGEFDAGFLELPGEVLESTLKKHQRYFPVVDSSGAPRNAFVTMANIESVAPVEVRRGNERVVAPRLADAAFFWRNDASAPLESRLARLNDVVYQRALGSIGDKVRRVSALCTHLCDALGFDDTDTLRAATLARCDLVTDMVGEFPDLQGIMGGHYARHDGESDRVATAIREQYFPRFAGDAIPSAAAGQVLSVADRLDTLAGIFAIGKRPGGSRDPFALRRSAVGLVRILIEGELDVDLVAALAEAVALQPVDTSKHPELAEDLYDFVMERLRHYYSREAGIARSDLFDAVLERTPRSVLDFDQRLRAVARFVELPEAEALAAANKRIVNILRSAGVDAGSTLDVSTLSEPAAVALANAMVQAQTDTRPMIAERDYTQTLSTLASLQPVVDMFFDDVMVMAEDTAVRRNRLALLSDVRGLFLEVADVSELQSGTGG
ncbi:MAG: glycine--tRNA ligase subunit beta [Pseudomonadota bacterium]